MQSVEEALEQIDAALQAERVEEALKRARQAARLFPQEPEVHAALGAVLWWVDDPEASRRAYEEAVRLAPEWAPLWADLGRACFSMADFGAARQAAERALALEDVPEAMEVLCRLAEREGQTKTADQWVRRAHALEPEAFPLPFRVDADEFRRLVTEAVNEIPENFQDALAAEVAILVEPVPSEEILRGETPVLDPLLLGLYVGVPLPEREDSMRGHVLPDRIYLFQHNLEHEATTRDALIEQIRITLFHEVGHYFGFSDEELEERDFG